MCSAVVFQNSAAVSFAQRASLQVFFSEVF